MAKRPSKSESLTIRLDPKTRFMLEFIARLRGQTITTVVERAISAAADDATFQRGNSDVNWRDYWHVNEGVRALRMARAEPLHPTYEEERRLRFAEHFWPFFYTDSDKYAFNFTYLDVLWPHFDELVEMHEQTKASNYLAVVAEMQGMLQRAKLEVPTWPPTVKKPKNSDFGRNLDDEIPF